jgi:hypothetical protein
MDEDQLLLSIGKSNYYALLISNLLAHLLSLRFLSPTHDTRFDLDEFFARDQTDAHGVSTMKNQATS